MKKFIIAAFAAVLSISLHAQTKISVQAPDVVSVSESFSITFVIEDAKADDFEWNCPDDAFMLIWGPSESSSSSVSIINGKRTSSSTHSYSYAVRPRKVGEFVVPAASAKVKGKTISSLEVTIRVIDDERRQPQQRQSEAVAAPSGEDLFLRLTLSKRSAVVGESLTATLKLYSRVDISGFEGFRLPSFDGFWSQETEAPTQVTFNRDTYEDRIYNVALLRRYTIIPQQTGTLRIDPAEVDCLVRVKNQQMATGSILDFFMDDYQTVRRRIVTDDVSVKVRPLPEPAPFSFNGGVGKMRMGARLTRDSLDVHEAASLIVTVKGSGNVSLLEAPKVFFPPDFEAYDVKVTSAEGEKTFEYPFIPRAHGRFTVPAVEFSYYDVDAESYKTIKTDAFNIRVGRGAGIADVTPAASFAVTGGKDVRDIGSDIRFISNKAPRFTREGEFFVCSLPFWIIAAFLVLLFVGILAFVHTRRAINADIAFSRNRKATGMSMKRLSRAGKFLKENKREEFYAETHNALLGFVSDKMNMDMTDLSKENIAACLSSAGVSKEAVDRFTGLLDTCELVRYSPTAGADTMQSDYEAAINLISEIDGNMKPAKRKSGAAAAMAAVILFASGTAAYSASEPQDNLKLWNDGCECYVSGDYSGAIAAWEAIAESGEYSAELYYNTGNAWFKNGDYTKAILNYRRALKLDPSYSDAEANLEFARNFIQDRVDSVPEFFMVAWARSFRRIMPSDVWAIVSLVLFALALALALIFLVGRKPSARRSAFFISIACTVLSVTAFCNACLQKKDALDKSGAVVTAPVCVVTSSPGTVSGTDLFVIHEGTEVTISDSIGEWAQITLPDGRSGWMKAEDLESVYRERELLIP